MKTQKATSGQDDKVKRVMDEWKSGKLKSSSGQPVTDRNQALAIALHSAGITGKSLAHTEMVNRAKQIRTTIKKMIDHELAGDAVVRKEIIDYATGNPNPEINHICKIAEKHGVTKEDAHSFVCKILSESLVRVNKTEGKRVTKSGPAPADLKGKILDLFRGGKPVDDSMVHKLADDSGVDPSVVETMIYGIAQSIIAGGLSKGMIEDVDPAELADGIKVEMEHTDDKDVAEKISRDHLKEVPDYYTKLKKAGL